MSNGIYEIQGTVSNQYPLVGGTYILTIPGGYGPGEAIGESIVYGKFGTTIFSRGGSPDPASIVLSKNQPGLFYYSFIAGYVGTVSPDYPVSKQIPVWIIDPASLKPATIQLKESYEYVGQNYSTADLVIDGYVYYLNNPISIPLQLAVCKPDATSPENPLYQTTMQSDSRGYFSTIINPSKIGYNYYVKIFVLAKGFYYGSAISYAGWYQFKPTILLMHSSEEITQNNITGLRHTFKGYISFSTTLYIKGQNLEDGKIIEGQMIYDGYGYPSGIGGWWYMYKTIINDIPPQSVLTSGLWEFYAYSKGLPGWHAPAKSNSVYVPSGLCKTKIRFTVNPGTAIIGSASALVDIAIVDYGDNIVSTPASIKISAHSTLTSYSSSYNFTGTTARIIIPYYWKDAIVEVWSSPASTEYYTFDAAYGSVYIIWYSSSSTLTLSGSSSWCSATSYPLTITLQPSPSQTATIELYENDSFIGYAYIGSGQIQTTFQVPAKMIISGSATYTYQAKFIGIPGNLAPSTSNKLSVIYYAPTQLTLTSSAYSVLVGSNFTLTGSANPRFSGQARIYQYFNGTTTMVGSWNTTGTTVSLTLNRSTPGSYYYYLQDLYNNDLRGQSDTIEVKVGVVPKITIWDSGIAIGSTTIFGRVDF